MERKIIHIDMDAFYASVEERDNPDYRRKPLVVGGKGERSVVAAASYEARKFGIHSAMAMQQARLRCKNLIIVEPRIDHYKTISRQIRSIFYEYTPLVEPLSLDEAYLDVTQNLKNIPSATIIAREIKQKIYEETQLTASAGISINKFLAKTASDVNKPNGLFVIKPDAIDEFIKKLPVKKFYGIGKVTATKMHEMGIFTGNDLRKLSLSLLKKHFGKSGEYYFEIARGIDKREVNPERERKSLGAEETFNHDIRNEDELKTQLLLISQKVSERLSKYNFSGRTLTLKIKYADFDLHTKSHTSAQMYNSNQQRLFEQGMALLRTAEIRDGIRLLGLSVSNPVQDTKMPDALQLTIEF